MNNSTLNIILFFNTISLSLFIFFFWKSLHHLFQALFLLEEPFLIKRKNNLLNQLKIFKEKNMKAEYETTEKELLYLMQEIDKQTENIKPKIINLFSKTTRD